MPAHTRHLLRQIAQCGYRIHVALSGRSVVGAAEEGLTDLDIHFHPRPNIGLDFGAWQDLQGRGCADGASEVLLANDSVLGPLSPLPPLVTAMRAHAFDVWGMVESQAIVRHLQSWFIVFTQNAFAHPAIRRIFAQPFTEMSKPEIILHGELGLGLAIEAAGLRAGASWQGRRGLAKLLAVNPMHTDWLSVLASGRAPFIKTELLRDNPSGIHTARNWRKYLPGDSLLSPDIIADYLATNPRRTTTPRAGFRARMVQALASEQRGRAIRAILLRR